jgi:hypothetical protein
MFAFTVATTVVQWTLALSPSPTSTLHVIRRAALATHVPRPCAQATLCNDCGVNLAHETPAPRPQLHIIATMTPADMAMYGFWR